MLLATGLLALNACQPGGGTSGANAVQGGQMHGLAKARARSQPTWLALHTPRLMWLSRHMSSTTWLSPLHCTSPSSLTSRVLTT